MRYQLILQWPASAIQDYDAMVAIEEALIQVLPSGSEVDGHDAGSGEVNIFIHTDEPARVFNTLKPLLAASARLASVRVAFREQSTDEYTIFWPEGLEIFKVT